MRRLPLHLQQALREAIEKQEQIVQREADLLSVLTRIRDEMVEGPSDAPPPSCVYGID